MDDFEKAVLFSFDQSGVVDDGLKACAAPAAVLTPGHALASARAELSREGRCGDACTVREG